MFATTTLCQNQAKCPMGCAAGCPMMAAMVAKRNEQRSVSTESASFTHCGCQRSLDSPAWISIAPEQRESPETARVDNTLAGFASIVVFRAEADYTPPEPEPRRHSQSVLCTFLI